MRKFNPLWQILFTTLSGKKFLLANKWLIKIYIFKSTVLKILLLKLISEYFRKTLSFIYRNLGLYWFRLSIDLIYFVVAICTCSLVFSCIYQCLAFPPGVSNIFKFSINTTLPTKVSLVKAVVFPVVMYEYESWTVKKAERRRIDAFELWCWRRLLRVPWTARRSNQSILKEISPGCSLEGLMLKLKLQYFGHLM